MIVVLGLYHVARERPRGGKCLARKGWGVGFGRRGGNFWRFPSDPVHPD